MNKKHTYFEAVRVVERAPCGRLTSWWPGERVTSEREAKADAVKLSREFPDVEYQVLRIEITERGAPKLWKSERPKRRRKVAA